MGKRSPKKATKKVAKRAKKPIKKAVRTKKPLKSPKSAKKQAHTPPSQQWGLAAVWNASLTNVEKRKYVPRNYLWASELGKAPIDLYLRLKGTRPSNPPDARAQRKFEAGNVFEWIVSLILMRAGILRAKQTRFEHKYPRLLKVTGKCDFEAGGKPDYKKAIKDLEGLDLPEVFLRGAKAVLMHLQENYPDGLADKPLEIKSVSRIVFDGLESKSRAMKHHRIQLFHYLKTGKYPSGLIVYICRDDLRMLEIEVLNPGPVEDEYKDAIRKVSKYVLKDQMPPKEEELIFNDDTGRFERNWNVAYSEYLKKLYGYKHQQVFDDVMRPMVSRFNRVLTRAKKGEKMTDKNLAAIKEIEALGFNWKRCVEAATLVDENGEE